MNINELTIKEAKEILDQAKEVAALFGQSEATSVSCKINEEPFIGEYVIVRTFSAGVFAGILKSRHGSKIVLENSRRLWRWFALDGISLSEVSQNGINPDKSRICCVEPLKLVEDIEIIPCSDRARKTIEDCPVSQPE